MALEDSEQKQNILRSIYPELDELSALIETNSMVQQLNQVNEQVTTLQRKIMEILPHVQHLADVSMDCLKRTVTFPCLALQVIGGAVCFSTLLEIRTCKELQAGGSWP